MVFEFDSFFHVPVRVVRRYRSQGRWWRRLRRLHSRWLSRLYMEHGVQCRGDVHCVRRWRRLENSAVSSWQNFNHRPVESMSTKGHLFIVVNTTNFWGCYAFSTICSVFRLFGLISFQSYYTYLYQPAKNAADFIKFENGLNIPNIKKIDLVYSTHHGRWSHWTVIFLRMLLASTRQLFHFGFIFSNFVIWFWFTFFLVAIPGDFCIRANQICTISSIPESN